MTLCAVLIVVSATVLLLDGVERRRRRQDPATRVLLWAHVFYLLAAVGLELGSVAPFAVSASLVVVGTQCGLVAGYIGICSAVGEDAPRWFWLRVAVIVALGQATLAAVTQDLAITFVQSSVINGTLALVFALDIRKRATARHVRTTWLLVLPFAIISAVYFLRLALVGLGAPGHVVVIASIGIGLVFPMATVFWVFGAMSLRNFHLTRTLDQSATQDALTGLGNRVALERFKSRLPATERRGSGRYAACICIDLDHFKEVNDAYGHSAGDAVLVAIAERLTREARASDKIFRIGGDEFVLWRECDESDRLDIFLDDLLGKLCKPILYGRINVTIGASIGFDVSSKNNSPWDLIRRADIALYRSKDTGRNRVTRYTEDLGEAYDARLSALEAFRAALEEDQLEAFFQPQINAQTGALTGCEALARWRGPDGTVRNAAEFMPLAEELGLMQEVDRKILELAGEAVSAWAENGTPVPRISVNVSVARLLEPSLIEELSQWQADCPARLSLEVLETVFIDHDDNLAWQADGLRDIGVDLEIDDFGTGHASISAVLALQPARIKIDSIFVSEIEENSTRLGVLRSLVDLAHQLGAQPVIEGVEKDAQIETIRNLGPLEIQGFAVAHPMDFDTMTCWLTDNQARLSRSGSH